MSFSLELIQESGRPRSTMIVGGILWVLFLAGLLFVNPLYTILAIPLTAVLVWWAIVPTVPIYLMALTYPLIGFEIVVGALNAPVVDVVAVGALFAWILRLAWFYFTDRKELKKLHFPGVIFFIAWLLVAFLSVMNSWDIALSIKYVFRPIAFFYLAYVLYVVNVIQKSTTLWRLLFLVYLIGFIVALYGLYGLAVSDAASIWDKRVTTASLFGINPIGGNHNSIADIMVTTIPIGFFLMLHMKTLYQQKFIFVGLLLMIAVNLLTFSRTGWLALLLEFSLLAAFQYRHHLKQVFRYSLGVLLVLLPLVLYMVYFSLQSPVQSSNENRLILNDIALEMFQEHPWFGQGPGTFIPTVERNNVYIEQFGAPLDAHGIVQKVGSELGVLGLIAYISLATSLVWLLFTNYRTHPVDSDWSYLLISLLMMMVGTIFFQLFQTSYYVAKLWFPIGLALSALYVARSEKGKDFDSVITHRV